MTVDTADFAARRYSFRLTFDAEKNQYLRVNSKFPRKYWERDLELHICDALELVTGQTANWFFINFWYGTTEELRIRATARHGEGKMVRPIPENPSKHEDTWELFAAYLDAMCDGKLDDSIGRRLRLMREPAYWGNRLLKAAIQVEGVLVDFFPGSGRPMKGMKEAVDLLFKTLDSSASPRPVKNRLKSSLGQLRSKKSPASRLRALGDNGIITGAYVNDWEAIRNGSAHADLNATDVSNRNLRRYYRCVVLFYQLVFHLLGYEGNYVDYGSSGHPVKQYPK